jgi:ABC-2 type transport system ATP-binding protein
MSASDLAVDASGLCLSYGGRRVLDDLSLAIPAGAVVGLVGPNGSGKSTLLRCLLGLSVPDSGESHLLDCPSLLLDDPTRERLGYVAQTPDLFQWMEVWEHIETIGRAYANWSPERATRLAVQLGLPLGATAGSLSVGDQQKLAVVLALSHDPDLVLMDEPVASLDPIARRAFMRTLFAYREDGAPPRTVLISSHLLGDLERVVSHVAFMRAGRIQLMDEWDALIEHLRVVDGPRPDGALHIARDGRALVDLRRTPGVSDGSPVGLDELFVLLNT